MIKIWTNHFYRLKKQITTQGFVTSLLALSNNMIIGIVDHRYINTWNIKTSELISSHKTSDNIYRMSVISRINYKLIGQINKTIQKKTNEAISEALIKDLSS